MGFSTDELRRLALELLGREVPTDELADIARRLGGLLERARGLDEARLHDLDPALAFPVGHAALQSPPAGRPAWSDLPATPGASGYTPGPAAAEGTDAAAPPLSGPGSDLPFLSAAEAAERIRRRELSPVELTRAVLDRAAALQPRLNSYITLGREAALAEARAAEEAVLRGEATGPLHGVPMGVKDCFYTTGLPTTGGSRHLAGWMAGEDAAVVSRLRAAGAVLLGKTHTHEWFFGGTSNNEHYGPARNPWDPDRVPGGSSGGSAAAVAAGSACFALGSDAAGSVRIPAAACGVVGLKPTYGRVSKAGCLLLTWSFDTVGWLTRDVADAALLLELLAGPDPRDATSLPLPAGDYRGAVRAAAAGLRGLRAGFDPAWLEDRVEAEVRRACLAAMDRLRELGAEVREVGLPSPHQMLVAHRLIALPESASYHTDFLRREPEKYSDDVRLRLEMGQFMLARDYLTGQRLRGELCRSVAAAMEGVDVLLAPTLPLPPPLVGAAVADVDGTPEVVSEALIRLTAPFNLTGQPAISVPCGLAGGLPVGLDIVGRPFQEETVLRVAAAYEGATDWHRRRPGI